MDNMWSYIISGIGVLVSLLTATFLYWKLSATVELLTKLMDALRADLKDIHTEIVKHLSDSSRHVTEDSRTRDLEYREETRSQFATLNTKLDNFIALFSRDHK